jgi:nucleoside-diphosphate-sugar epimerase
VWRKNWPPLMEHIIAACSTYGTKLVFFDNVYMYDRNALSHMTEETPVRPSSKKGEVRARIARMLLDEVQTGKLTALIARSADFYGPNNQKSVLFETVYKNLRKGKKANWFGDANKKHACTYTPDAAKATALLGNTPDAYNQVWHLPTASNPPTGKEWVELFAHQMNLAPRHTVVPLFMLRVLGVFVPIMRELHEMAYQYDRDYVFDSSKFEKRFSFQPTPYGQGVKQCIQADTLLPQS